jgi:FkbM family methyltransferase
MNSHSIVAAARNWLNRLSMSAPFVTRLLLRAVYPFPRVYAFVAKRGNLSPLAQKRIWSIAKGPLKGFRLTSLLPDEIVPIHLNSMEARCSELLTRLPLQGQTVLDVGGSYGYYALLLSRLVGPAGRVYTFEPDWHSFARLTQNLALNDTRNVLAVPLAASNLACRLMSWQSFESDPWNSRLTDSTESSPSAEVTAVPVTCLDEFTGTVGIEDKVRLIKIDVEGTELMVLQGVVELMKATKPLLLVELHSATIARQVCDFIEGHGYAWERVDYMSEDRQHIFAFASDQASAYRRLIPK